jgi:hypothetical protein
MFKSYASLLVPWVAQCGQVVNLLLIPRRRVLPLKLTVSQLSINPPHFRWTQRFITAYTRVRHLSLSWARSHQSFLPNNFLKILLCIIPPSMPGPSRWFLSLTSPHPNPVRSSALPHTRYMPRQSHSSLFYHRNGIRWGVHIVKLLVK